MENITVETENGLNWPFYLKSSTPACQYQSERKTITVRNNTEKDLATTAVKYAKVAPLSAEKLLKNNQNC